MTGEFDYPLILHFGSRMTVPLRVLFSNKFSHIVYHDEPAYPWCWYCSVLEQRAYREGNHVKGRVW